MAEGISVVIPVYNAATWQEPTVERISTALHQAGLRRKEAEIILVNDGSTDDSLAAARALQSEYPIMVVDQENKGRFLARKAGLLVARKKFILFIDSRVYIHEKSLQFVREQLKKDASKVIWNGHVIVDKKGNIIARFGDAITFLGWRRYFKNPHTCSYGLKDFDHYPKGTTLFFAPRQLLLDAVATFERQTYNIKNSSDDTHLIRLLACDHQINLSPQFSCTYHARTKLSQFFRHSYHRGCVFVDGFLRPGNRFFLPLIVFLAGSVTGIVAYGLVPALRMPIIIGLALAWFAELVGALLLGVGIKDALSLFVLSPLFALAYGFGIWRATVKTIGKI